MTDRITVSLGETIPGDEPYSSRRIDISYATDALEGETAVEALARARAFVGAKLDEELRRIAGTGPRTGAGPGHDDPKFDPKNPEHVREAKRHLKDARVGEQRQGFFIKVLLPGRQMGSLAAFIRDEVNNFAEKKRRAEEPYEQRRSGWEEPYEQSRSGWGG